MATERLLVPLDRSTLSEAVLPYVKTLARGGGLPVTLLTVWEPPDLEIADLAPGVVEDLRERGLEAGREYLERTANPLREAGVQVDLDVRVGDATEAILNAVAEHAPSLIAMATHGRAGLERVTYGSVADRVMRLSPVPALLVRPPVEEQAAPPDGVAIRRILVPLDGSDLSMLAVPHAVTWARRLNAELHLVRAVGWAVQIYSAPISVYYPPTLDEELANAAEAYLKRAREAADAEVRVQTAVVRGFAPPAIQGYAREHGIDLIVMATHGRGGLVRAALGSTADRVVRSGAAPVLLVRPGQPKEGA